MLAVRIRKEIRQLRKARVLLFIVLAADGIVAGIGCAPGYAGLGLQAKSPRHAANLVFTSFNAKTDKVKRICQRAHLVKRNGLEAARLNVDVVTDRIVESPWRRAGRSAGRHRQVRAKPDLKRVTKLASNALHKASLQ